MLTAKEVHIKASPERAVEEMKASIDLPVVTVDPNHGIGHYEDHVGWQFIGHVSSDGFKVIRRYRPGSRPSQMFMSWDPGTNGSIYAPTFMGRIREEENGTPLDGIQAESVLLVDADLYCCVWFYSSGNHYYDWTAGRRVLNHESCFSLRFLNPRTGWEQHHGF